MPVAVHYSRSVIPGTLRIGLLGAARIAPMALIRPARHVPEVQILAVAARDRDRARAFAGKHGIERVHGSYQDLLADPEIDAVYNPLPNGLHGAWTIPALEAGKHVLCEKPLAANAEEAEEMERAARRAGRVLMEAFHWRYHPLAARMRAVIDGGELGAVRHVEARFCIPLPLPGDIRYDLRLAGGATMDTGCYAISIARFLAAAEPEVVRAEARTLRPGIDRWMEADLRFADGRTGRIECALLSARLLDIAAVVRGDRGEMRVFNPVAPHLWNSLRVITPAGTRREHVAGDATYTGQLRAFLAAVRDGAPVPTGPEHGVANMRVIDAVYEASGLGKRQPTPAR